MCGSLCVRVSVCVLHVYKYLRKFKKGIRSLGSRVASICELPDVSLSGPRGQLCGANCLLPSFYRFCRWNSS